MNTVAITGATGLIGRALSRELAARGVKVIALTRSPASAALPSTIEVRSYDPNDATPHPAAFEGVDAVVHLAGETVAGRWNDEKKRRIYDSRVLGTRNLVASLASCTVRPAALIVASASGFYGDRDDETLTEDSSPGSDFLARVCSDWEREAQSARALGIRTVCLRTGIVLSSEGGALEQMRPPFQLGLGGPFGSGRQFVPWIHLDDLVRLYIFAIEHASIDAPLNAVAPDYATSARFAQALGASLCRPALFPAPGFALRLALGEFADSILASQLIVPARTEDVGFTWRFRNLEAALASVSSARSPWNPNRYFTAEQFVPQALDRVFAFFSDARNLEAITPPSLRFHVTSLPQSLARGAHISYDLRLHGLPLQWKSLIARFEPPHRFVDVQLAGPYAYWEHVHEFEAVDGGTLIRDAVSYALPFYPLGNVASAAVDADVKHIFAFRRSALERLL